MRKRIKEKTVRSSARVILVGLLGVAGCGQVSVPDEPTAATTPVTTVTTVTTVPTTLAAPTTSAPVVPTRPDATVTAAARATTTPTAARATTATTRLLSRAEATSSLCTAIREADERIQRGSFLGGGLRLSGGLAANEKAADPAVVTAARSMLRAGLDGNPDAYVTARSAASTACARAGYPIQLSGPIQCFTTPCP